MGVVLGTHLNYKSKTGCLNLFKANNCNLLCYIFSLINMQKVGSLKKCQEKKTIFYFFLDQFYTKRLGPDD